MQETTPTQRRQVNRQAQQQAASTARCAMNLPPLRTYLEYEPEDDDAEDRDAH